uniref:U4/U6.U5 tri-snRNP-associated protein 1 n=1 Tax=Parastrongyloides trichosuri TaxID=131310 RepID=A0A0N4Z4P7_PARTI
MNEKKHRKRKHSNKDYDEGIDVESPHSKKRLVLSPSFFLFFHYFSETKENSRRDEAESLSIEETNRIRAELGLAPLQVDTDQSNDNKVGNDGEKIIVKDGIEIHHKPAENLAAKKETEKIKERLEVSKRKRQVYEKVLKKDKGLADSDSDDDVANWLEKTKEKVIPKISTYDELDDEITNVGKIESDKLKKRKIKSKKNGLDVNAGGLIIGHSKEAFLDGTNTILVLKDKHVLDEDEDEVLINPNLVEDERAQRNVLLRKKQDHYGTVVDEYDEWGNPIDKGVLAKYDEVLEGEKQETFRLNEEGCIDAEREAREFEIKKKLRMERLNLQNLETEKRKVASDFFTEDEILTFRKPKKKRDKTKSKKSKETFVLEGCEMDADEKEEKALRLAKRNESVKNMKVVENHIDNNKIDLKVLLDDKDKSEIKMEVDGEESDEELKEHIKLASIVIEDDFQNELNGILNKAHKLKQLKNIEEHKDSAVEATKMLEQFGNIKKEINEESKFVIDSTSEYCRHIGTFDNTEVKEEYISDDEINVIEKEDKPSTSKSMFSKSNFKESLPGTFSQVKTKEEDDDKNVRFDGIFGKEAESTRGVAAMLRLAGQKGYLENKIHKKVSEKPINSNLSLPPSKIKVDKSHVEDDAYTKKMERISRSKSTRGGNTFEEKVNYNPQINISYADSKGRELDPKQAFRELSWKFHGKAPGKKQTEKRLARYEREDKMKKMNSCYPSVQF